MHANPFSARYAADHQAALRRQAGRARLNRSLTRATPVHHPLRPPPRSARRRTR